MRVCLDTGHALIPLNGSYINPTRNGDAVAILKLARTPRHAAHPAESRRRRAIRHAGQAPAAYDGGLIDWESSITNC
ncbi:MAG: hypothetical protein ACLRMJ_00350 [Alistipes finegoldii]